MMKHAYTKLINISQIRNKSKACIIIFTLLYLHTTCIIQYNIRKLFIILCIILYN